MEYLMQLMILRVNQSFKKSETTNKADQESEARAKLKLVLEN